MRIIARDGDLATLAVEGLEQRASLVLLPDAQIGDFVLVHAGYAITLIDEEEAAETMSLLVEIGMLDTDREAEQDRGGDLDRGGDQDPGDDD
jgi:hydrogenase expression/formation protein HypC